MRTVNGDMTTAEGSKFFDDPDIDGEVPNQQLRNLKFGNNGVLIFEVISIII